MESVRAAAPAGDIMLALAGPSERIRCPHFPEISLPAAILDDAMRCVQRSSRGVTCRQNSEAIDWIISERCDWPFAFVNICDWLGIDAVVVREQLRMSSGTRVSLAARGGVSS